MKCHSLLISILLPGLLVSTSPGQTDSGAPLATEPRTGISSVTLAPKTGSSTSANKQFTIHGADLNARSTFILLCEESAGTLGKLLKDDGRFLLPIVVVLKTPPDISLTGPAVTTSISELSYGGFHFQMTVQLRNDFRSEDFTMELVRVLLAERILRNHKSLQTTRQRVLPDWLLTGVSEAMDFRSRARPSLLFSAVFKSGQVYSIDRIIDADPAQLDAMARGIYEASSCALVLTLLDQPDGPVRFTRFLDALAQDNKSDRDLLKKHFPTLGVSKNSLEKWWTLQMAALATPSPLETLSLSETEVLLDKALTLHVANYVEPVTAPSKPETAKSPGLFHKTPAKEKAEELPAEEKLKGENEKEEKPKPEPSKPEPVKEAPKPEPKKKEKTPKKPATPVAPAKEEPKDDPAEKVTKKPKSTATIEWDLWMDALSLATPFKGGQEIAFPFRKSAKPAEEEPKKEDEKKDKPAEKKAEPKPTPEKKPDKPAKKSEKPEKEEPPQAPEAVPALPPKVSGSRNISGKPEALPAPAAPEKPKPDGTPEESAKKPGGFNPLGWFRKNTPEDKTEPPKEESKPVPAVSKPKTAEDHKANSTEIPLDNYSKIWKRADRIEILRRNVEQLNLLKVRAHPLYKDVIGDYAAALQKLVNGNDKGMTGTLEQLHQRRDAIHETAKAVESHLDWFEASGTVHYSGTFNDYFKLRDELDKQIHPRSDALSQYLDAIEKEYEP